VRRRDLVEVPDEAPKGFNLQVTYRDEKTGQITHTDPYILRVMGEEGSRAKSRMWERPAGSGNLFDKHNNPIGRWVTKEEKVGGKMIKKGTYVPTAEHIAWEKPLTKDQMLSKQMGEQQTRIAELEKELASITAEKTQSSAPKKDKGA